MALIDASGRNSSNFAPRFSLYLIFIYVLPDEMNAREINNNKNNNKNNNNNVVDDDNDDDNDGDSSKTSIKRDPGGTPWAVAGMKRKEGHHPATTN